MEEDKATANAEPALAPEPQQPPKPVMDVTPPRAAKMEQPSAPAVAPDAAAQPEAPKAEAAEGAKPTAEKPAKTDEAKPKDKEPEKPKKARTAPVGVIVAALFIFVALSVLAYYAYSKG